MALPSDSTWDLARLRTFVRVAAQGSLTRAAVLAGTPQPVVSRQITRFEQECGGRLFLRTGRGVRLTELGERVLPRVQALLREAEQLSGELDNASELSGEVKLGVLPSLHRELVMPLFLMLRERHPRIRLRVFEGSSGQIDPWVATGFVDIGIGYRYGRKIPSDVEPLAQVGSWLVGRAGDPLTQRKTVKFTTLAGLPLVLPGMPSAVRVTLDQLAKKSGIVLDVVMEADSGQIQKAAAIAGAWTVLPLHAVRDELEAGTLQVARIVEPRFDRILSLAVTSARPASRSCREVAQEVRRMIDTPLLRTLLHDRTAPR